MNQAPPPPPPPPVSLSSIRFAGNDVPKARNHSPKEEFPPPPTSAELQYANLPKQLVTALNKDKKPFTYTPASSIGKKGILDLDQIRSPRMRKRLMLNLKESEEDVTNSNKNLSDNNNNVNYNNQQQKQFNNSPRLYEQNSAQQQPRTMSPLAYTQNNIDTPPPPPPLPNMHSIRNFQQQVNNYNRQLSASPTPPLRTNSYGIMTSQPAVAQQVLPNLQRPMTASPTMNQMQTPPSSIYGDETRREPIQSRSFLILQRMTQDYMEPLPMNNLENAPSPEDPRYPIPSRTFRVLQEALGEDRLGTDF